MPLRLALPSLGAEGAGTGWAVGTMWGPWEPGDRNAVTGSFSSPSGCRLPLAPQVLHAFRSRSWMLDPVLRPEAALVTPRLSPPLPDLLLLRPSSRRLSKSLQGGDRCEPGSPVTTWLCLSVSLAPGWDVWDEGSGLWASRPGQRPGRCPEPGSVGLGTGPLFPRASVLQSFLATDSRFSGNCRFSRL